MNPCTTFGRNTVAILDSKDGVRRLEVVTDTRRGGFPKGHVFTDDAIVLGVGETGTLPEPIGGWSPDQLSTIQTNNREYFHEVYDLLDNAGKRVAKHQPTLF